MSPAFVRSRAIQAVGSDSRLGQKKRNRDCIDTICAIPTSCRLCLLGTQEYDSSIWSPLAYSTSINKLQVMQKAALRTATGCTQDTNIQHLHDETLTLPIHEHLQLYASQYKQKTQHPSHPLHKHTTYFNIPRQKKHTIFNNGRYTTNISTDPHTVTTTEIKTNMRHIHTSIVSRHL